MSISLPPDELSRTPATVRMTDANGRRWQLGFDEATSPPGVVWTPVQTWGYMKQLFATWGDVRHAGSTWGLAKTL